METIQVVLDRKLLARADRAARRMKVNRSALFRTALTDYLGRLQTLERERLDREGYERVPQSGELAVFETIAVWPEDD
jgi:metal-responsive CopG/Arc/MetJ family transcriptional regulator